MHESSHRREVGVIASRSKTGELELVSVSPELQQWRQFPQVVIPWARQRRRWP